MSLKRKENEEDYALPKKTSKKVTSDDEEQEDGSIFICEISKNRRVSVRNWQGKVFVDIREFYIKDGKQMPGKKGISLSMDQWKELRAHVDEIDKALA
ncbi:hypothetical protein R6Q57_023337 [Mikania cordata]